MVHSMDIRGREKGYYIMVPGNSSARWKNENFERQEGVDERKAG